ncbi:17990_t:CDS:10, partial [Racocetra fulgida]
MSDRDMRGSGSAAATSQKGGYNERDININSNLSNTTIFVVHLPHNIDPSTQPIVIGSCASLGEWKEPKVLLHQVKKTSLWCSNPVQIPISEDVFYKYAMIVKSMFNLKTSTEYEGQNQSTNRKVVFRRHQFDVWQSNSKFRIDREYLRREFLFVDFIYSKINGIESLRDWIMDYQYIMKAHQDYTIHATNLKFINKLLLDSTKKEQRIFLCVLLGHLQSHNHILPNSLPESFQSANILEDLASVDSDFVLSDIKHLVLAAIRILVQHNSQQGSTTWYRMFSFAPKLDLSYSFVDSAESYDFKNNCDQYYLALRENVKPHINELNSRPDIFHKVMKQLIIITYNLESLIFLWNEIIGLEKVNDPLYKVIKKKINELIKSDDPSRLKEHFDLFPNELQDIVAPEFRNKLIMILYKRNLKWQDKNINSFQELLRDDLLQWSLEEYGKALEAIAESDQILVLETFPDVMKCVLEQKITKRDEAIFETSIKWLEKIISYRTSKIDANSTNNQDNIAHIIFYNLSLIYPLFLKYTKFCSKLKLVADKSASPLSDDVILSVASYVEDFDIDVIEHFSTFLKARIEHNIQEPDNRLQQQSDKKHSDQESHRRSSIQFSEFWSTIFRAKDHTEKIRSHPYVQSVRDHIVRLAISAANSTIVIGLLQELFEHSGDNNDILINYFNSAIENQQEDTINLVITDGILDDLRQQCKKYQTVFARLTKFYDRFYPSDLINNYREYRDDLISRQNEINKITLEETVAQDYWSIHCTTIEVMEDSYKFIESKTFSNVFQTVLKGEDRILTVDIVTTELIQMAIEKFNTICADYNDWENIKCSEASMIWQNVDPNNVEFEVSFIVPNCNRFIQTYSTHKRSQEEKKLVSAAKYLISMRSLKQKLINLITVLDALKIPYSQKLWVKKIFQSLEEEDLKLSQLQKIIDELGKYINKFNLERCWPIIREMADSKDFLIFLQSLVGHDLKNLINGVDDHSDERLIQEDTVSTFIRVKQILEPLVAKSEDSADLAVDKFLRNLFNVISKNPTLDGKVRLCNAHAQALKNMYENISNRGEVTKEKIYYAVTKGVYTFQRMDDDEYKCTATLSYQSNHARDENALTKYTFNDLQDLRGRALLIAKSPVNAKTSDDSSKSSEISTFHMNEFVIQVDMAQQIINMSSQLVELGHFDYRDFKVSTNSTQESTELLQRLNEHLQEWKGIVSEAQHEYYYLTFFLARQILAFYDYFTSKTNNETNKDKCAMLLRLVNDEAELPPIVDKQIDSTDHHLDILRGIGERLSEIFNEVPAKKRQITADVEQIMSDVVHPGQLFVAACNDKFRVPNIIMSLYAVNLNRCYPESWQLLICKASTTAEELLIFTKRCFFAEKNGYGDQLFCIANVENLDFELQYQLVTHIRSLSQQEKQFNLALICCREHGMHHHILDQFSEYVHITNGLNAGSMRNIYKELCPNVSTVSSDLSGQGKTEWIKECSFRKSLIPRSILISDGVTFEKLVRKLSETEIKGFESLHLNIMLIDHPYDVNMFLFELLTFRVVSNGINIAFIPSTTLVFIEVASTMNQYLLDSLPITGYLAKEHLTWNIRNLAISYNYNSPIQIVAKYLDAYDRDVINQENIDFIIPEDGEIPPMSQNRCQELFQRYFFRIHTQDVTSYRFLEIFINVLADQLVRLSSSTFFRVETLREMVEDKSIRKTLLETLLDVSIDFATRSVESKAEQLKHLPDAEKANLGTIKQWEDSNHLLVFFMSQTPDSICALYRDKEKVPDDVVNLLKSQYVGIANQAKGKAIDILDNFDEMHPDEILKKLECLARTTLDKREYPPYALSTDNLLKMALILLRARANVPVVCCGEAGCGKTSLIQFLSIVVNVEFRALNLHAGVREQEILDFMSEAEKIAENGQVWLFFDEINTCNHIGLLADLIAHRQIHGQTIHPNIRLFSACNPYRLRQKGDTQAGLAAKRYEEQSKLAYQVHPLPDQIIDYVWDYGVLKPSDEKIYIYIMVHRHLEKQSNLFPELLAASQQFTRDHEGVHSVSLRDVKRAIILVKYFFNSLKNRPRPQNQRYQDYPPKYGPEPMVLSFILALSLCYQVRIYDQELHLFKKIIKEEQENYMARMTKPPQTAENEALLENVLTMIVSIFTKIPLFVVGAPGASKSLAIRLVSQNLRGADSDDPYFKTLPQVYVIPYQGSSSSTSDGIIKVFQKAENYQKTNSKEFPLNTVVLLDEDLVDTAERLFEKKNWLVWDNRTTKLKSLASSYLRYEKNQSIENFHGLRDYYSLIKSLSDGEANLKDKDARHLMIIGKSDSIINILTYKLRQWSKEFSKMKDNTVQETTAWDLEPVVIYGSQFPDDFDGDYQYGVLSRIMKKVSLADPPLLNRFEKQNMSINDTLTDDMKVLVNELSIWVEQISSINAEDGMLKSRFNEHDMFVGFDKEETLQSLVIYNSGNSESENKESILSKCKELLVGIATSDGIVRSKKSILAHTNSGEVQEWYNFYFHQKHDDLNTYIQSLLENYDKTESSDNIENVENKKQGFQIIVNTFSNINTDITSCLGNIDCQIDKISTFKSEAQLQNRIKHFWLESDNEILILQCDLATVNSGCIKLAKFIIEQYKHEFLSLNKTSENPKPFKHVCIILHMRRENDAPTISSFNFMCGWDLITIETLPPQQHPLHVYLDGSLIDMLETTYKFEEIINQELFCLVRKPIAKFLCALEMASGLSVLFNNKYMDCDDLYDDEYYSDKTALLEFWKNVCMDPKIINTENMREPQPDVYPVRNKKLYVKFPFSIYFMRQIDKFKRLYEEDLAMLEEDEENIDTETGELGTSVVDACIERFSSNIISAIPILKSPQFFEIAEPYFNDFVDFVSPIYGNNPNDNCVFLSWIISHHMGQKIPNPIKLHMYWWKNAEFALAELQLSLLCPIVIEEMLDLGFDESRELNFEEHLLDQISKMMIEKLYKFDINNVKNELLAWQHDVVNIISLSTKLPNSFDSPAMHRLRIYNDLSKSFDLPQLLELKELEDENEVISEQFIDMVFEKFNELPNTENNLSPRRYFIHRCISILPLESPIRLHLYKKIFSQEPLPLTFPTIHRIFLTELHEQDDLFIGLINDPHEALEGSERLQVIEEVLNEKHFDSAISALCCDVIQTQFFDAYGIKRLSKHFMKATEILITTDVKYLQRICAIAFLKTFVNKLWNSASMENSLTNPIEFDFDVDDDDDEEPIYYNQEFNINDLNQRLELTQPLIHSFVLYLLKSLRLKGYSTDDIRRFCEIQQQVIPHLGEIPWDNNDNRLGYNPYWCLEQCKQAEHAATRIIVRGDDTHLRELIKTLLNPNADGIINYRISFAGMIITRLYLIQASREWNQSETLLVNHITKFLDNKQDKNRIPPIYKQTLTNFLMNKQELCRIGPEDDNRKVYMASVIAHVIALHISVPPNSSPLAMYMQALQDCKNDFILGCPSDEQTVVINAVMMSNMADKRLTRPAAGNSRLDNIPLTEPKNANDQRGYITETPNTENFYSIRLMSPASYRIIHLFTHAIIGIQAPSQNVTRFIKGNTNTNNLGENDMAEYCAAHINHDWDALKIILACGDEQLALLLHAIISEMTLQPLQRQAKLNTSNERETWELQFSQKYVIPLIKNVMGSVTDFRMQLETNAVNAQPKIESEINEMILHTSLSYRIERQDARSLTFRKFINDESENDDTGETGRSLKNAFKLFATAWNKLIPHVKRYQCLELPYDMPEMNEDRHVVLGFYEEANEGLFLCGAIDFLVQLQNDFLKEVIEIPSATCQSLKFLEQTVIQTNKKGKHTTPPMYQLQSISLEKIRPVHIVSYEYDSNIFGHSQFDLRIGHGREIQYDLSKIEAELAFELVHDKAFIVTNEQKSYMESFVYHKEIFQGSMTLLSEIKELINQETIPDDKKALFAGTYSSINRSFVKGDYGEGSAFASTFAFENPKDLLSTLEMILCFIKRASGGDGNTLITDYIENWMKLTVLKESNSSYRLLSRAGLQLKHIVALYELVEEHVADVVATCIHHKYKAKLEDSLKREISKAIGFETSKQEQANDVKSCIPAGVFAIALKRFIVRYLTTSENINESVNLADYMVEDEGLECWPDWADKKVIKNKFPLSLLVSHTFETYQYTKLIIE